MPYFIVFIFLFILLFVLSMLKLSLARSLKIYNKNKQKQLINKLRFTKTIKRQFAGMDDASFRCNKFDGWKRSTDPAFIHIKEEGLLIKPLFTKTFAIPYSDISRISVKQNKWAYDYHKRLIITSIGNIMGTFEFIMMENHDFYHSLKCVYPRKIRFHHNESA